MGEITENNKLIAEFMGAKYYPKVKWWDFTPTWSDAFVFGKVGFGPNQLKYNSSWDWLMPVVEKIEGMYGVKPFMILKNFCRIDWYCTNYSHQSTSEEVSKIAAVYAVVIAYIKWYNQQPK